MGNWTYGYDTLNRLTTAQNTVTTSVSTQFAQASGCWNYDGFGNRTEEALSNQTSTPCATGANDNLQLTVTTPTPKNQIAGPTYDLAGNDLYDSFTANHYYYDAEGRLCAVEYPNGSGVTYEQYLYDASGARVGKGTVTSLGCNAPTSTNYTPTLIYLTGLGGEQVTELTGSGAVQHTNVFIGGKLQATYDFTSGSGNGLHFALADMLGTKRVQVTPTGVGTGNVELQCMSLPFGNGLGNPRVTNCVGSGPDATEHHYTGKERDAESGNDYFEARYYSSAMGRFMSPDWSAKEDPVPYAKLDDPQTLNLYSYVQNNPLTRADADGHVAGVDDAAEGIIAVAVLGAFTLEAVAQYYNHTPDAQRSLNGAVNAAGQGLSSGVQTIKNKVSSIFNSDKKPGTKGKPDHQETAKEEAKKIGGDTEVRIPTPGGSKETRVGDAVATDANGKPTAVTQVIRPTPAGNVPLREQKAAQDIENATGVKPKLVPVRPLPNQ